MSPSLEKQYEVSVTREMRDAYFNSKGRYSTDLEIYKWYHELNHYPNSMQEVQSEIKKVESTGLETDFYNMDGCKDVDDLAEHWNLKGDEFNCLKAIAGIALGSRHSGTSPIRDANKLLHYANRIVNRLNKDNK